MKILLLEDDLILNEIIEEHLINLKYDVITTFSGSEAQDYLYSQTFDLLLFDVNVPDINGFELLEELRKQNIKTPAIFITSLNMADDMQKGFDSGCDDYIKKPFELKELDLRINNIKRLFNITSTHIIDIDTNTKLDTNQLLVIKEQDEIHIAKKECEVLQYLVRNKDKSVSVDELILNVWPYEEAPNTSTIRSYIKRLRKILGEEKITNIRGVGYRLNS
ncbi:two-component response regulator [Malaciobacter pacificus]|jgi:DNA-binding response OmpR family regulator|uniref:Two-component system response regulator, putative CusR n=1 Tax=Malaciobacter pacificus TaxID=1080223 RepID=A0A5C2H7Q9_9BACT|nr:response regulator transcription factor [Malaciobacter pacificus]QEP33256.1 two-component system response regulator, putative CusR [Malaciobacter pacificus]GGD41362.1 two-component response regulator [Malaciobacter pacificus]